MCYICFVSTLIIIKKTRTVVAAENRIIQEISRSLIKATVELLCRYSEICQGKKLCRLLEITNLPFSLLIKRILLVYKVKNIRF